LSVPSDDVSLALSLRVSCLLGLSVFAIKLGLMGEVHLNKDMGKQGELDCENRGYQKGVNTDYKLSQQKNCDEN
jgi:hypothetical protein